MDWKYLLTLSVGLIGVGLTMITLASKAVKEIVSFRLLVERLSVDLTAEQNHMKADITEIRGDVHGLKTTVGQHAVSLAELHAQKGIKTKPA